MVNNNENAKIIKRDEAEKRKEEIREKGRKRRRWLWLLLLLLLLFLFGFIFFKIGFNVGKITKPVTPDPTPQKLIIKITDNDGEWKPKTDDNEDEVNTINVFSVSTSAREYVAPYDHGIYEFDVTNLRNKNIIYNLSLEEENEDKVNIKYKLKKNGEYIIGQSGWVYYDQVKFDEIPLTAKGTDSYELEWCWVSEDNEQDTKIGLKKERALYTVTIKALAYEDI